MNSDRIMGHSWDDIQRAQQRGSLSRPIAPRTIGQDYGSEPAGNGMVRMIPSGDIVTGAEAFRRLDKVVYESEHKFLGQWVHSQDVETTVLMGADRLAKSKP